MRRNNRSEGGSLVEITPSVRERQLLWQTGDKDRIPGEKQKKKVFLTSMIPGIRPFSTRCPRLRSPPCAPQTFHRSNAGKRSPGDRPGSSEGATNETPLSVEQIDMPHGLLSRLLVLSILSISPGVRRDLGSCICGELS